MNDQNEMNGDEGLDEGMEQFEDKAREMGWVPEEEWEGDEGKWVDAKTFVKRGEEILPIVRSNNKRLQQKVLTQDKEIASLKASIETANKTLKALQTHYDAATKKAVEDAKTELRSQLKQAKEIGDVEAEIELLDKLDDLKQSQKEIKEVVEEKQELTAQNLNPEFVSWNKENPWFGDTKDPDNRKRTRQLIRIGEDLREDGDETVGRAFMDKCIEILERQEGKTKQIVQKGNSKVEGGNAGGRGSSSRAFDKLSREAQNACHEDNDKFVGPGKMFKTVKEWEDHFAKLVGEE